MKKEFDKVYCIVTIGFDESLDFSVQMYDDPLFSTEKIDEWWYHVDTYGDGVWFYDFSYNPSVSEIIKVLLPKLKELGFE